MPQKLDVLVLGELNVDIILNYIDGQPEIGKEKLAGRMDTVLGSSAAIFASNLSSLGKKVGFMGKIGNDNYRSIVLDSLEGSGVDTSSIIISDQLTTGATVILNYGEDRAMVTYPGAMEQLSIDDIDPDVLSSARHLHFSSYFLQPGLRDDLGLVFKKAKELGLTTSLDPQWDPREQWHFDYTGILPFVDVFLPNSTELLKITGTETIENGIAKLKQWCNNIVIKDGRNGAIGWVNQHTVRVEAFTNDQVVDAIGAGDSFNAGFISKFIDSCPIESCITFGNLIGAISTTAAGGTGAFKDYAGIMEIAADKFNYTDE